MYDTEEWWMQARKRAPTSLRRDFDARSDDFLVGSRIWKEKNTRIFRQEFTLIDRVFEL
jgi:hypothetical protein